MSFEDNSRVVNGLQHKVPVFSKRPYFLAANVFIRDDSVSVSLNINPRVCMISMHALENREKSMEIARFQCKFRIPQSQQSLIELPSDIRVEKVQEGNSVYQIANIGCLLCDCYRGSTQKHLLNE